MYKLFLSLRYLRRRPIALVAIVGMALCVFMVLVVASVMNGFLVFVEDAARGMGGDVIIDGRGGIAHYDAFIADLKSLPHVAAATPVIRTPGLLKLGPRDVHMVSVVGIKLPEAAGVTAFSDGLFPPALQADPAFRVPDPLTGPLLEAKPRIEAELRAARERYDRLDLLLETELAKDEAERDSDFVAAIEAELDRAGRHAAEIRRQLLYMPDLAGIILGVDLPHTTRRDPITGEYTRRLGIPGAHAGHPGGEKAQLTLLPIGRGTISATTEPVRQTFQIVGDHRFGLYLVDSSQVYVDFDVLQRLIEMDGRCDQIQVRINGPHQGRPAGEAAVAAGVAAVRDLWGDFADRHRLPSDDALIQTWREKHGQYIDAIEKQRDLMVIILGVISMVAVVLVFAIFYMLVVQKTKDIGILKSIGASSDGVAWIFLLYGSAVGLVGSIFGAVAGYYFVIHINPIHDWIARAFGWRVFSREAYMFDRIPNDVNPWTIVAVMVGAMAAGLVGAILPALRAARMQPVEALRYE